MATYTGTVFPNGSVSAGDEFYHTEQNGRYVYLGGDVKNMNNWKPNGVNVSVDFDTSLWDSRQNGANWFNTVDQQWKGLNGLDQVQLE